MSHWLLLKSFDVWICYESWQICSYLASAVQPPLCFWRFILINSLRSKGTWAFENGGFFSLFKKWYLTMFAFKLCAVTRRRRIHVACREHAKLLSCPHNLSRTNICIRWLHILCCLTYFWNVLNKGSTVATTSTHPIPLLTLSLTDTWTHIPLVVT